MRSVTCMSQDGRRVRRDFCDLLEKPKEKSVCSYGDCRTTTVSSVYVSMKSWYTTDWSRDVRYQLELKTGYHFTEKSNKAARKRN